MAFLIQRAVDRSFTLLRLDVDSLRIGRGTNQELRSENPAVSLEHAVITADAAGYLIHDRGSITGTYVNGNPVEAHRIVKGDVIGIGDLRLEVQMADHGKPLFLRVTLSGGPASRTGGSDEESPATQAAEGSGVLAAPVVDYAAAYRLRRPWLTKLTITALLLIAALTVIGEVILRPSGQTLMMPGGVSSAHARAKDAAGIPIATRCEACHTPWKSVTSAKCASCHQMRPHAVTASATPGCFSCHAEHRGTVRLSDIDADACIACHADLTASTHPERAAAQTYGDGRYGFEQIRRIAEFGTSHPDFAYPVDASTLRFNHAVHLEGKRIFDARGKRETLACSSCHLLTVQNGATDPAPIRFEQHCQRCHLLTFDRRLPDLQVPHGGDAGIVYGFVVAAQRGGVTLAGKSAVEARRILATQRSVTPDQRALSSAELVFKTRCSQCHALVARDGRAAVVPPVTRTSWLSGSRFTHGPHRATACETCHAQARTSRATSDVLMPRQKDCSSCHGATASGTRSSSCLTCHEYHRPEQTS